MLMHLVEQVGSDFDPECVNDLGWVPNDWTHKFNPDHVKDISDTAREHSQTEVSSNGAETQG